MFPHRHAFITVTLAAATACFGTSPEPACTDSLQCKSGSACQNGTCQQLCDRDTDCSAARCIHGLCSPTQLPQVSRYVLEASAGAHDLVTEGNGLSQTPFTLRDAQGTAPTSAFPAQSATRAPLMLPPDMAPDMASGAYTLTAVNHAGTGSKAVTLTLPELSGDEIITRINQPATTGLIDASRLEPAPFASYRGYVASNVSFSSTYYGLISPTTHFSQGGITVSGGDIRISQAGVYMVTAVAALSLQLGAWGILMVSHLDSSGTAITNRFHLTNDDKGGANSTILAGSTLFELAAGDKVRFEVASSSNTGTWFLQGGSATNAPTVVTIQLIHPL